MKVFKYLFISSIMFAVTSCGNDWLAHPRIIQ